MSQQWSSFVIAALLGFALFHFCCALGSQIIFVIFSVWRVFIKLALVAANQGPVLLNKHQAAATVGTKFTLPSIGCEEATGTTLSLLWTTSMDWTQSFSFSCHHIPQVLVSAGQEALSSHYIICVMYFCSLWCCVEMDGEWMV